MTSARRRVLVPAGVCAALAGAILIGLAAPGRAGEVAQQDAAPKRPALVVGVVDMSQVFAASEQWKDSLAERARLLEKRARVLEKLSRNVELAQNRAENEAPGTPDRRAAAAEVELAAQALQDARRALAEDLAKLTADSWRGLLTNLNRACAQYAREQGIHLVLKKADLDQDAPQAGEGVLQLAASEVLFVDPTLDISGPVIDRLNAAYEGPIEEK